MKTLKAVKISSYLRKILLVLILTNCSEIYFEKSLPENKKTVAFPDFLSGTFKEVTDNLYIGENNFGNTFYSFNQVNDYSYEVLKYTENNVDTLIRKLNLNYNIKDARISKNTLIVHKSDTTIYKDISFIDKDIVRSKFIKYAEIELKKETAIFSTNGRTDVVKCELKTKDDTYFFNILIDTLWLTFIIKQKEDKSINISIMDSEKILSYLSDSKISEDSQGNKIAKISDREFYKLVATEDLFETTNFKRINSVSSNNGSSNYTIIIATVLLAILFLTFIKLKK